MRKLLITGTDSGVGKTLLACALAYAAHARGMRVGVMKPAETGCENVGGILEPADARALSFAAASNLPIDMVCPYRYRSPLAPAAAAEIDRLPPLDIDEIVRIYRHIAEQSDVMIVEGTGGLAVPITWERNYADLARILDLDAVVVVANRLGCLNAAMLTFHCAKSRGVELAGFILNDTEAQSTPATVSSEASLRRMTDVRCLGRVRFKEPVRREIIDALLGPPLQR